MILARVVNNIIVDTAVDDALRDGWVVCPDHLGIGDALDKVVPQAVPLELTPRQVRLVLNSTGMRAAVEAAVLATDQNTKDMWAYSSSFKRNDPVLNAMAASIGITQSQLDQMFISGAKL
jgi:hypothetical protein